METSDLPLSELLNLVFPEQASATYLLVQLQNLGLNPDKNNREQILKLFYTNFAALPRRTPHDNRRGRKMLILHKKEQRLKQSFSHNALLEAARNKKDQLPKAKIIASSNIANSPINQTPELDRLQARSKAVLEKKNLKRTKNDMSQEQSSSPPKKLAPKQPSLCSNDKPVEANNYPVTEKSQPTSETLKNNKASPKAGNSSLPVKRSGKIKLKRNSLHTATLQSCKVKKET